MLQGTLQLHVARPRTGLARELSYERHALSGLSIVLVALVAVYLYFVAASILNVMARSDAEHDMRAIEGSMGALEQQYLALSRSVDQSSAASIGLLPIQSTAYVYRPVDAAMVDRPSNQI